MSIPRPHDTINEHVPSPETIEYEAHFDRQRLCLPPQQYLAYRTKKAARAALATTHNPVLVEIRIGDEIYYDAYPAGYPLPLCAQAIERYTGGKWRTV